VEEVPEHVKQTPFVPQIWLKKSTAARQGSQLSSLQGTLIYSHHFWEGHCDKVHYNMSALLLEMHSEMLLLASTEKGRKNRE